MKTSTILLSIALAFRTIYSKAIYSNSKIISEQLSIPEEDNSFELVESDNFIYKFHCSDEKEYCDKIKNDLDFAFATISNAFEIYQPIVFEAFVDDLGLKYGIEHALAGVTDPNFVALKTSKSKYCVPYIYPQALVKQLKLNKQPKYKKNDFIMEINNFNSNPKLKDNEFRSIMVHELLHGLGFMSLTKLKILNDNNNYSINDPDAEVLFNETEKYAVFPYNVPLFSEELLGITDDEEYMDKLYNTKLSKFLPHSIFDKYIVSLKSGDKIFDNLKLYYKELNEKCLPEDGSPLLLINETNKFYKECLEKLSPKTQEIVSSIARDNYFKSNTLGILTKDGEMIPLQTLDGKYISGSSVSHINDPFSEMIHKMLIEDPSAMLEFMDKDTKTLKKEAFMKFYDDNYVLYYSDNDDFTVEEMLEFLKNNPKHPLIGDGIVKIMKTLGWNEKGDRPSNKIYYLDETIDVPEANGFEYENKKLYEIFNPGKGKTTTGLPVQDEIKPTTPVNEKVQSTTPINEKVKPTTPINEKIESTTPINEEIKPTTPINEKIESTTPINEKVKPTTPVVQKLVEEEEEEEEEPLGPENPIKKIIEIISKSNF